MVDLVTLVVALLVVLVVFVRRTSAGVAIFGLLAGVLLDQLLSSWVISLLPPTVTDSSEYAGVIIHLLITFVPVAVSLVAVKVAHRNGVLSLLTGLVLGFLIVFFGLKILAPLPQITDAANNAGLLTFLSPYQNTILAASAILAIVEMIVSHRSLGGGKKTKNAH